MIGNHPYPSFAQASRCGGIAGGENNGFPLLRVRRRAAHHKEG